MAPAALSLFRNDTTAPGLARVRPSCPTIAVRSTAAPRTDWPDGQLIGILDAPLAPGETSVSGFARKEQELGAIFAALSVVESRELHARLVTPKLDDELANKFGRLTLERRSRLVAFLRDARRREALQVRR